MKDYQAIIEHIRAARISTGKSQEKLAEDANLSTQSVHRFESGGSVNFDTMLSICEALGLSFDEVAGFGTTEGKA